MNKQLNRLIAVLIALLLSGVYLMSAISFNVGLPNSAVTSQVSPVWVNANNKFGPWDGTSAQTGFRKIQEGINNASAGGTVNVEEGIYPDLVTINVSNLNLVGQDAKNTVIDGASFFSNGIKIPFHVENVSISNFKIENCFQTGILVSGYNKNITISGNIIFKNKGDGVQTGLDVSDSVIVQNDILDNLPRGIYLSNYDASVNVSSNMISAPEIEVAQGAMGIEADGSNYLRIFNNSITQVPSGIYLLGDISTDVKNNTLTNVASYGLLIEDCHDSTVEDNIMNDTGAPASSHGIRVRHKAVNDLAPETNLFQNNTLEGFQSIGMVLENWVQGSGILSTNNTVRGNTFQNCGTGVQIDENLSSNYVYHNNFVNNLPQAIDKGYSNSWTEGYPCGGNYWSDYKGNYSNLLGDTPYNESALETGVKAGVIDECPLEDKWPMRNFWCSEGFSVAAITSSSSISNFTFDPNTGITLNVTVANTEKNGSCTVIIPKSLMDGAFNLLVDDISTACYFNWSNLYHKVTFNYGNGSHYVKITAESMNTPTVPGEPTVNYRMLLIDNSTWIWVTPGNYTVFPDLNGDGSVGLHDLVILATHYNQNITSTSGPEGP
jgi:parallel beta-helix repeat protein